MTEPNRKVWLATALLGLTAALLHLRPLLLGATWILRDHMTFEVPARTYLGNALASGRIPEWHHLSGFGCAFAANPNFGVTYPPMWLTALLPAAWAMDMVLVLHVFLAGLGVFFLSRRWGASNAASILAGCIFMSCGYVSSVVINGLAVMTLAWTPWLAWATDRLVRSEHSRQLIARCFVLSLFAAAQILSGDPAGLITCSLVLISVWFVRAQRKRIVSAIGLLASGIASFAMTTVALLPGLSLLQESGRASGVTQSDVGVWSLHPLRVLQMIWPRNLGLPHGNTNLADLIADASIAAPGQAPSWSLSAYVSVPVVILAVWALLRRPNFGETSKSGLESKAFLKLGGAALLFLLLALGTYTPIYGAYRFLYLPERLIRYPEKHVVGFLLFASFFAGVGLQLFLNRLERTPTRLLAIIISVQGALVGTAFLYRESLAAWIGDQSNPRGTSIDIDGALETSVASGSIAFLVSGVFAALFLVRRKEKFSRLLAVFVPSLVIAHLGIEAWTTMPFAEREYVTSKPIYIGEIEEQDGHHRSPPARVYRPRYGAVADPTLGAEGMAIGLHETLMDGSALRYGIADLPNYNPARTQREYDFWDYVNALPVERVTSLFDMRFAVLPDSLARATNLPRIGKPLNWSELMHQPNRRPRAYVTDAWRSVDTTKQATIESLKPGNELTGFLVDYNEPSRPQSEKPQGAPCEFKVYQPEHVVLACENAFDGLMILQDAHAPGWSATRNGNDAEIHLVNGLFRGVFLPQGENRIEFRFRTPRLRLGFMISLTAMLCCGFGAFWFSRSEASE